MNEKGWEKARKKAEAIVSQMTAYEKISQLLYTSPAIERLGIPAIVGIRSLTAQIHDGDLIEMDGATGIVRKLEQQP